MTSSLIIALVALSAILEPIHPVGAESITLALNSLQRGKYEEITGIVSAYTSDIAETDDTPTITASGKETSDGVAANNCLPFGSKFRIDGKEYEVWDRMNSRYGCDHFDIWMEHRVDALQFGRQEKMIEIYAPNLTESEETSG